MSITMEAWLKVLSTRAEEIRERYVENLNKFLRYIGMSADELYEKRRRDLESDDPRDKLWVERKTKAMIGEMLEESEGISSSLSILEAVKSFFRSQGIELEIKRSDLPRLRPSGLRSFTKDELKRMLREAESRRNEAFILVAKDSGLNIEDLRNINCGMIDLKKDFTLFGLRTREKSQIARVCLGPEALEGVKKYLDSRKRRGEIIKENTPLLVKDDKRITTEDLKEIFNTLTRKSGLREVGLDSFRNFHTIMLRSGRMPKNWIMILQGRAITDDDIRALSQPEDRQLLEAYKKAYNNLKIFKGPMEEEGLRR